MGTGESGTMVGAPADIVIADAVLRDVPGLDAEAAWRQVSCRGAGHARRSGSRASMGSYATLGFVPVEESDRSVGVTVEYAHADFALANLARKLGHAQRSRRARCCAPQGWRTLFDPANGVLRAHHADGTLVDEPYSLTSWDHYAEANALQTTFMPLWDAAALEGLFGSRENYARRADRVLRRRARGGGGVAGAAHLRAALPAAQPLLAQQRARHPGAVSLRPRGTPGADREVERLGA